MTLTVFMISATFSVMIVWLPHTSDADYANKLVARYSSDRYDDFELGKGYGSLTVRFEVDGDLAGGRLAHITKCYVEEYPDAVAESGKHAVFQGNQDKWTLMECKTFAKPSFSLNYDAIKICATKGKEMDIPIATAIGEKSSLKMSFECSEAKPQITKCQAAGETQKAEIPAETKGSFGGNSKAQYEIKCSDVERPYIVERFVPEICYANNDKRSFEVTVEGKKVAEKDKKMVVRLECNDAKDAIVKCIPPAPYQDSVAEAPDASVRWGSVKFGKRLKKFQLACNNINPPWIKKCGRFTC